MMAGGGVGDRKRGKAATAEDSRNFTEEFYLPSFGMHPIYPVRVLACVCACVCVVRVCVCVACWQEGFQHINITLPHKETQASVRAFSRPNKHGSSSTLGVRGKSLHKWNSNRTRHFF